MLVSVGIPFLNAQSTLADAITSVFAQTFEDWELILVDDGSSDRSMEIAMAVDDPRVRVVSDGLNRGLHARCNEIARLSRGIYCARMDADDIMHPERLARQVALMEQNPEIDIAGTAVYVIDGDGNPMGIRHTEPLDASPAAVVRSGFICHPTSFARTQWCLANPYDESFTAGEDHELYCRVSMTSGLARLREPLFYYREAHKHPQSYMRYYRTHAAFLRKCYMLYGPKTVGWPGTIRLVLRSHLKTGVYRLATALGIQEMVIRRRHGRELTENERQAALEGLEVVRDTRVPGLEGRVESLRE